MSRCFHKPDCLEGYSTTVFFYKNLHLQLSISLQLLHGVAQNNKVFSRETKDTFRLDKDQIILSLICQDVSTNRIALTL